MWESNACGAKSAVGSAWRGCKDAVIEELAAVGSRHIGRRHVRGAGCADGLRYVGTPLQRFNRAITNRTAPDVEIKVELAVKCIPAFAAACRRGAATHRAKAVVPSLMQLADGLSARRNRYGRAVVLATLRPAGTEVRVTCASCGQVILLDAFHW